jgi:hypothetical protein
MENKMFWNKKQVKPKPIKVIQIGDVVGANWIRRECWKSGLGIFLGYTDTTKKKCNIEIFLPEKDILINWSVDDVHPCLDVNGKKSDIVNRLYKKRSPWKK